MQQQTDSWLPQIGAKLRKKVYKTAAEQQAVLKDDLTKCSTDRYSTTYTTQVLRDLGSAGLYVIDTDIQW